MGLRRLGAALAAAAGLAAAGSAGAESRLPEPWPGEMIEPAPLWTPGPAVIDRGAGGRWRPGAGGGADLILFGEARATAGPLARFGAVGGWAALDRRGGGPDRLTAGATALPKGWPAWLPAPTLTVTGEAGALAGIDLRGGPEAALEALAAARVPTGTARVDLGAWWGEVRHDAERGRMEVEIPAIGLAGSWRVETGEDAARLARRLLRRHGDDLASAALRWSAAETPDDPLAGNPGSLLTRLFESAAVLGASGPVLRLHPVAYAMGGGPERWDERVDLGGPGLELPIAMALPVAEGVAVSVTAPIRHESGGGGTHLSGGLGLGLSVKPLSAWTLGGMLHWGGAAETDRAAGAMAGVSGLSRVEVPAGPARLAMTSQLSSFSTLPVTAGGTRLDYDLSALVARNGVAAALPFGATGPRDALALEVSETRFLGADLYVERSYEAGLAWSRRDGRGRDVAGVRLSGALDDAGGSAVRLGLELAF